MIYLDSAATTFQKPSAVEAAMVEAARRAGVRLRGLSGYYMERVERCPENTVVLGYASLGDGEIPLLAEALAGAWGTGPVSG